MKKRPRYSGYGYVRDDGWYYILDGTRMGQACCACPISGIFPKRIWVTAR